MLLSLILIADLQIQKVRDLTLQAPLDHGAFLAGASGLVKHQDTLYVVADDELHLGLFKGTEPGTVMRLFDGGLDKDHATRKKKKPDVEALALLRPNVLLALGSGSTADRMRGALIEIGGGINLIDFSPVYAVLAKRFSELNIEGAAVIGSTLRLLQRGNGKKGENAIVDLDLAKVHGPSVSATAISRTSVVDLGELDGVPLSFTDASPLPDGRLVFIAAAEASASTYDDGEVKGSVVGIIDGDKVKAKHRLSIPIKAEGVHATLEATGDISLLFVNDADNPNAPAMLFSGRLPKSK